MSKLDALVQKVFSHPDNFGKLIGYDLESFTDTSVRTSLSIADRHLSPAGVTHGGVISAFVDFSMGAALFTQLKSGERTSTIEFKINYLSPVKLGEKIHCDAKVKFKGKSHAVLECHVFREEGKDVAFAVGTYNIY
ncbi:MAG TPA: PaaI family thioesterase [bacterium]|nr:PaaI family thioesterase [bacterium]